MSGSGAPELAVDGQGLRVVVVAASWHETVMNGLLDGARRALADARVAKVTVVRVPGAFELPVAALRAAIARRQPDGVVIVHADRGAQFRARSFRAVLAAAVIRSASTRAKPIALTGLAAMIGALFILDDPIFNGLAISLIFGISVSTVLTLVVIPVLYYAAMRGRIASLKNPEENPA